MSGPEKARMTLATPREPGDGISIFRLFALLAGAVLWVFVAMVLREGYGLPAILSSRMWGLVPALAWALPALALFISAGRWAEAVSTVVMLPLMAFISFWLGWRFVGSGTDALREFAMTAVLSLVFLAAGLLRYLGVARQQIPRALTDFDKRLRRVGTLLEILVFIFILVVLGSLFMPMHLQDDPVRPRVSELILAGSSAKTALSEGMQTYGTWSSTWMSGITIAPIGMVASATIGPTGQIIVRGTEKVSHAVVTMTPNTTTDNKLVWTCTGEPRKYMPASCR